MSHQEWIEHHELYEKFRAEKRAEQKKTGCTCNPQMVNAGHPTAVEMYLEIDDRCPVHGIATDPEEQTR